jgi:hypothetical protein
LLLDNFLELWTESRKETIALACRAFFKDTSFAESKVALPEGMIQALIRAGRKEDLDSVKGKIWGVLMKTVPQLQRRISPPDLAFGLWFTDPVSRGNMTRYLFTHWHPKEVLEAALGQIARSRAKDVPTTLPDRAASTLGKKQRSRVIVELLMGSGLVPKEKQRLFSVLAETLTRFDLIQVLPLFSEKPDGVENGLPHQRQMHFTFARSAEEALLDTGFGERVSALLEAD